MAGDMALAVFAAVVAAAFVLRIAKGFFAAVRRVRVTAAFFPAARWLRVFAAFLAAVRDFRVFAAFFAAGFRETDFDAGMFSPETDRKGIALRTISISPANERKQRNLPCRCFRWRCWPSARAAGPFDIERFPATIPA